MAGKAPGALAGKPRKTKTRTVPYWVPWDNNGAGGLRFIAADTAHDVTVKDNQGGPAVPYYEAKGFIPQRMFTPEMNAVLLQAAKAARAHSQQVGGAEPAWATLALKESEEAAKAQAMVGADAA